MDDLIRRSDAVNAIYKALRTPLPDYHKDPFHDSMGVAIAMANEIPSAQPERVWTPCDIPPNHHKDVIVRGVEAIGNVAVYKTMQWDVDRWRPENYAPSIRWLEWCEI